MNSDEYNQGYRRLAAVEEQQEISAIIDGYADLYRRRYKVPFLPLNGAVHARQLKDFRMAAKDRAYELLNLYFESGDDWFVKQTHSVECLLKNLNKLNALSLNRAGNRKLKDSLRIPFYCDACWDLFDLVCEPTFDFLNVLVRCPFCAAAKKPLRRISKEERISVINTLKSTFPALPKELE